MPQTEFSKKLIAAYEAEVKNSGKGSTSGTNITERTNARAMQNDASFVQQYAQGRQNYIDQQERKGWVQTRMRQKRTDSKAPEIVAYNAAKAAEATQAAIERYNNALTSYSTKVNDATQKARSYGTTAGEIGAGATGALHSVMGDAGRTTQSSQTRRDVAGGAGVLPGRILTDGSKKSGITDAGTVSKTKSKSKSDAKLLTSREPVTDIAKTIQDQRDSSKVAKPITADTVAPASKTNLFSQAKYQVARTAMESAQQRVNEAQTVEDFNKAVSDFTRAAEAVGTMEAEQIVSSGATVRQEEFVKKNASAAQGEQLRKEYQALELLLSPSAQAVTGNASALWASAAMSEKERKDASARLSQLGRLIQLNDQYSSPAFKVSQLNRRTLGQQYQSYSSFRDRREALLVEAADYRREADRFLAQGDTKQYREAVAQAHTLERQADGLQAQMDSITGGDAEYADALVRQGSAAALVSDAASDKNFDKYVQAGKNKGFSPELREWLANAATADAQKYGYTSPEAQQYINQMTDEQRDTFYYYVGKGDTAKAQEFFSALEPQLEQAVSAAQQMGFAQFTQEHPVAGTAINAASQATIAPILGVMSTAQNVFNSDMRATPMTGGIAYAASDANQGASQGLTQALMYGTDLSSGALTGLSAEAMFYGAAETAKKHGMTEEQLAEAIQNEDHGEAKMSEETASFLAGNIVSMANNLAQMGVGMAMGNLTGAAAGAGTAESINATQRIIANIAKDYPLAIMGTTAATEQVRSALESGQDLGKALAYGALVGAVEVWTENIGIEEFISGTTGNIGETLLGRIVQRAGGDLAGGVASVNNAALRAAFIGGLNISGNALSEGMEEVISNIVDVTADVIINGEDSELAQLRNQLMEQGMDVSEAMNQAWLQLYIRDTAESFAGGALSGALFGIGGGAIAGVSDSYNRNTVATRAAEQMLLHGTADDFIQGALDISDRSSRAYQLAERLAAKNDRGVSRTVEADGRVVVDSTDETSLTNVRDLKNLVLAVADYNAEQARQKKVAARLRAKETARANKSGGTMSADSGALSVAAQRYMDTGVLKGSQARAIGAVLDKIATGQNVTDTEIHTLNAKVPAIREQLSLDLGFEIQSGSLEEVRAAINHYQENNRAAAKEADGMKAMNDAARAVRPYVRQEEIAENRAEVADAMEATRAEADTELAVEAAEEDALAGEQAAGTVQEIDRNVRARQEQETAQRAAREERDAIEALRDEDGKISYKAFADYYKKAHADAGPSEIQRAYENVNQDLRSGTVTIDDQTYTWSELKKEMELRDMDHSDAAVDRVFLEARSRATEDGGTVRMSMTEAEAAAQNKKPAGKYSESNPNRLVEWTAARFAKVFRDDGVKIEVDYDWKGPARSNAYHRVNTDGTRVIVLNGNMSSAGIFNQTIYRNQRMITLVCAHELGHDQWIKIVGADGRQTGRTNQNFMDEVIELHREIFNLSEEEVQAELDRHRDTYSSQINPGEDIDDYVREEYAADCLGELMVHTGGLQRAIEMMDSSDPGIFRRTLNRIKAFADGITGKNKQATEMRKAADDLLKRFQKARDAAAEYRAEHGTETEAETRHSISTLFGAANLTVSLENGKYVARDASGAVIDHVTAEHINQSGIGAMINYAWQSTGTISEEDAKTQKDAAAELLNMVISAQDGELVWRFAGSAMFSAVKSNSDGQYGTTVDFSTVCRKTQEMVTAMSEAMTKKGAGLTKEEVIELQGDILTEGGTVPCPVCYVFSRWAGIGGILDNMNNFQQKYGHEYDDPAKLQEAIDRLTAATKTKASLREMLREYDSVYASIEGQIEGYEDVRRQLKDARKALVKQTDDASVQRKADLDKGIASLNAMIKSAKADLKKIEAEGTPELAWLRRVRSAEDYWEHGNVDPSVLFNLNDAATFADKYPVAWAYRTSRGPSAGKAILPYSDMRMGDMILGVGNNSAAGNDTFMKRSEDADGNPVWVSAVENGEFNAAQIKKIEAARARVRAQNLIGGQRFQSTSDFRYDYGLDYLQVFWEAQMLGSYMQTYTKVIEFASLAAAVGGDVNLSVMPLNSGLDENGNLIYSDVTGINYEAAVKANEMYDNVQLILVGINDDHILAALDDFSDHGGRQIGFVIPYHASGASINQFIAGLVQNLGETFNVEYYKDYSKVQTDSLKKIPDATTKTVEAWMDAIRKNPADPQFTGRKPSATQMEALMRRFKGELRTIMLTRRAGKNYDGSASEVLKANEDLFRAENTDISDVSFDDLREIELRALSGDADAIAEYESWSAGVLWNVYNKMWLDKSAEDTYGVALGTSQAAAIMPHEYWNTDVDREHAYINGFIFRSYCFNLGLNPRFTGIQSDGARLAYVDEADNRIEYGDFSGSTGYWKTLIDRPMYDNNGIYRAQQPLNATNVTGEMLTPEYGEEQWAGYKVQEPSDVRAKRAADRFLDRQQKQGGDVRYSIPASEVSDQMNEERDVRFSLVDDQTTLDFLNDQDYVTVYRAMQEIDGQLYPPMAARTKDANGKWTMVEPMDLGRWYQSDENLLPLDKNGKAILDKANGSTVPAAYNPYWHTSKSMLNDQFSSAWKRPNLVVVEGRIPVSELTSGYRAEGAKDTVGATQWHSGPVAGQLNKAGAGARIVYLSRWFQGDRVVPDSEVAASIADTLKGTDIAIPDNVVTPSVLSELQRLGVPIKETGKVKTGDDSYQGVRFSVSESEGEQDERKIRSLREQLADLGERLEFADLDGMSETEIRRMRNQYFKLESDLNRLVAKERSLTRKTSIDDLLENLDRYRRSDLESLAEQISDGEWDDYEEMSDDDLRDALREMLQTRAEDMNALERQAPKYGFSVRPPATVRFSLNSADAERTDDQTRSDNFKAWFGDWENDPAGASKVVNEDGTPMVVYHGTDADFNIFDTSVRGGEHGTAEGFGIYLSPDQEVTSKYGDRQIGLYADIKRPATSFNKTITQQELTNLIRKTCEDEAASLVEDGSYDSVDEAIRDTWISNYVYTPDFSSMDGAYRQVARDILRMNDNDMDIVQEVMAGMAIRRYDAAMDFYNNALTPITGIDGFHTQWNNDSTGQPSDIWLAFRSEQLKSATDNVGTFDRSNPDIRYSISDADYMDAVNGGDTEAAQQMVDRAAQDAGYAVKAYHGTPTGGFTEFDTTIRNNGRAFGDGIYFTDSRDVAGEYTVRRQSSAQGTPSVYEGYLNLGDNVLTVDLDTLRKENGNKPSLINYLLGEEIQKHGSDASAIVIKGIYDGSDTKSTVYVVKDSSQFKDAAPVTYDDSGNVIPLSERFNTGNRDIRYSFSEYQNSDGTENTLDDGTRLLSKRDSETLAKALRRDFGSRLDTEYLATKLRQTMDAGSKLAEYLAALTENGIGEAYGTDYGPEGLQAYMDLGEKVKAMAAEIADEMIADARQVRSVDYDPDLDEMFRTQLQSKLYIPEDQKNNFAEALGYESYGAMRSGTYGSIGRFLTTDAGSRASDVSSTYEAIQEAWPGAVTPDIVAPEDQLAEIYRRYQQVLSLKNDKVNSLDNSETPREWSEQDITNRIMEELMNRAEAESRRIKEQYHIARQAEAARLQREAARAQKQAERAEAKGAENVQELQTQAAELSEQADEARLMAQTDEETILEAVHDAGLGGEAAEQRMQEQRAAAAERAAAPSVTAPVQSEWDKIMASVMEKNGVIKPVSKVRSNTFQNSGMFEQAELEMQEMDPKQFTYDPVTEKESMETAAKRLDEDYLKWYRELPEKAAWSGTDLDTAMRILEQVRDEARNTGDYSEVVRWAKIIQERGTQGGQFLQAFNKYTRTPEAVLAKAVQQLEDKHLGSKINGKAILELSDQNDALQLALDMQEKQNADLANQYADLMKELEALKAELSDAKQQGRDLKKSNKKLYDQISRMGVRIIKQAQDIYKLDAENLRLLDVQETAREELQKQFDKLSKLGRENTKVVQENSRLDRQIKRAENRYEALQAQHVEILAARDLINDFLRRGDLTVEEVEALGDRLRDLNARLKGYNDERTQSIKAMRDLFVKLNRTTDASEIQRAATSTDDADLNEDNKVLIQNLLDSLSDDKKVSLINDMAEYADVLSAAQEGDKDTLVDLILRQARTRGFNPGRGTRENLMKQDWSYLNQFALTQLANIADDYEKRGIMEKISTWQYIAQLMNLRTSLRNVTSNAAFYGIDTVARNSGALLDAFIGHFTGNRTVAFSKFGGNETSAMQGARERADRAALEVALDVDLGNAKSKYGEGSRRTFKMAQRGIAGALSRTMSRLEMVNGMSLNVTDEFFKGAIYQGTINSYAAMVDKGLITQEEAEQFAEQDMLYRTFQDETALGTILNGLHDLLNLNNPRTGKAFGGGEAHKFGLGDIIVKYRGVPGALVHRALEFSPGGYVKALYNVGKLMKSGGTDTQAQRNAVLGISRATTGSGLIALFAILAKLGLMRRDDDEEDKNVAALNRAEGLGSTQVNLDAIGRWIASGFQDGTDWREGDDLMDIGFMDPLSSAMTMGSLLFKNLSEGEGLLGALTAANGGMMAAAFSDLSMMNTINDAIYAGLYHDENSDLGVVGDVAITMASSGITGMIPSLLRQIAQASDLNYRDAYGGGALEDAVGGDTGAALQQALNNIMTTIPGLRQTVPTKIDPLGNEKVYAEGPGAWFQNAMNSLFNPGKVNKYTRGDVSSELAKIRTATGDSSFYPDRNGDKTVTFGDEKIKLNDEQRRQYLLDAGDTYEELALETINSEAYQNATAAEKAEMLKSVKSYSEYKARQNLYEEVHGGEAGYQPYQNDDWRKTEAGMSLGLTFSDMQTILRDTSESRMTPLYDENGDSIQGSYEQKLLDYLNGLDYSDQDKLQLYSIIRGNNGDSTFRKIQDTMDAGLSFFEAADVRKKYLSVEYQGENNTNLQEVDYFLDWLKDEGYNATEIDRIMENYQFRNSIQQDPSSLITRMTGNGVDQDTAFDLANDLAGLKPEEGRSQVSNQQKFDVIVGDYNLDVSDKQMAIAAVGGDTSLFSSLNESAAADLMNLYQATGDTGVLSMAPGQYCTIDSVRYDYDDAQIDAYSQAYIGIMNGTDFSGVTSSKVADGVKDIAANAGKFAAWQQAGWTADLEDSTFSTYRKAQQAQNVGLDMADYCEIKQACNDFTADKDANGNSISGSKKTKVVSYLQSLGLTSAQYNFFYSDIMGYK
jgi:chromosome segregation ATPase